MKLHPTEGGFTIEATDLAELFDLEPSAAWQMMREGKITTRFERGEGEDAGRCRVTFQGGTRRVRLTLDESGHVLKRIRIPFPARRT